MKPTRIVVCHTEGPGCIVCGHIATAAVVGKLERSLHAAVFKFAELMGFTNPNKFEAVSFALNVHQRDKEGWDCKRKTLLQQFGLVPADLVAKEICLPKMSSISAPRLSRSDLAREFAGYSRDFVDTMYEVRLAATEVSKIKPVHSKKRTTKMDDTRDDGSLAYASDMPFIAYATAL